MTTVLMHNSRVDGPTSLTANIAVTKYHTASVLVVPLDSVAFCMLPQVHQVPL